MSAKICPLVIVLSGVWVCAASAETIDPQAARETFVDRQAALADFQQAHPRARFFQHGGRTTRVYGVPFATGDSPLDTAERFRWNHADIFGVAPQHLQPLEQRHAQPLMLNRDTGQYKFTLVFYTQRVEDLPVFRADLRLLIRNEPGYPLVLAANGLRDLRGVTPDPNAAYDPNVGHTTALDAFPALVNFSEPELVIWAGVDDMLVGAAVAYRFIGDNGLSNAEIQKRLFLTDAITGRILYHENLILDVDIEGSVAGMATQGLAADFCEDEIIEALPYSWVYIGNDHWSADQNGDFTIPWGGTSQVTVESPIRGDYFHVENFGTGGNAVLLLDVIPPGPADFVHNADNTDGHYRSQVNGYVESNAVRDYTLFYSPDYPVIANQLDFEVRVNLTGGICPCNAQYTGDAIQFCAEVGSCPDMAFSVIVHHEYGHHLVAMGGSGQGAYGEGTGDMMGVLITDDPRSGIGFFGDCTTPARNAVNTIQYPCSGPIHTCGQLLTGCVWETRNELIKTEPDDYLDILSELAINAIRIHQGSSIAPDITIDYVTLDDDDGTIENGSPHYFEIDAGFSEHNMPAPEISLLAITYPEGRPEFSDPVNGAPILVEIQPVSATMDPDQPPLLHVSVDGGPFIAAPMSEVIGEEDRWLGSLPPAPCYATLDWYISAVTTKGITVTSPQGAPSNSFQAFVATGITTVVEYDFETDPGFAVSGDATDGQWDRGVPIDCNRGDPPSDFDGSGQCWLTDNSSAGSCNSDVDGGTTVLTSNPIDMSDPTVEYQISYARWFSNDFGNAPFTDIFVVEISNDDGATWANLETVGPTGDEVEGGWFYVTHSVNETITPTGQTRVRFLVSDLGEGSVVEAAVDALKVQSVICEAEDIAPYIVHDNGATTRPFTGYVDPRAESSDGAVFDLGVDRLTIRFSEQVTGVGGGPLTPGAFTVTGTGTGHPTVTGVDDSQNPVIALTLSGPIPVKEWTTVIASVEDLTGNVIELIGDLGPGVDESDRVDVGFLPADVDQSGVVSPFDLLRFRQIINDLFNPPQGTDADFVDIDRNGDITPFDLLNFRQLINGTGNATRPWSGENLPTRP